MRLIRSRRVLALFAGASMLALSGVSAAAVEPPADPPASDDHVLVAEPASTATTLERGGSSVTVSKTANLTRQMINVSWRGMPSSSIQNVYPVMVMQCRGANPSREDCWAGGFDLVGNAIGTLQGTVRPSHYAPAETANWYLTPPNPGGASFRVPFRKPDGSYLARQNPNGTWVMLGLNWPGEAGSDVKPVDDFTPGTKNFRRGITRADGTGSVQTWVNTKAENPSLGCSDTTECSLVVVPVQDRPCLSTLTGAAATFCKNAAGKASDANWQLLANWYQRYVFKLSFTPPAAACEQRNDSAKLLGSELVAEAMRRWAPARCQTSSPVGLDYTRGWEPDSRRQLGQPDPVAPSGYESDAVVTSEPAGPDDGVTEKRKPGYAPIAISGFAIGYNIERTEAAGGGQVSDLKLNPRLVAKLLTQSYPGRYKLGLGFPPNPNAPTNPLNLLQDPEFQQLNPSATGWAGASDSTGTQLAIPVFKTDVMLALTKWIWADPQARAFLQGKADQWGMSVNKAYRGWPLPRDDYQLNDGWQVPDVPGVFPWAGFAPQGLGSQSSNSWANGADVLMTAWPLTQFPNPPGPDRPMDPILPKRVDAQNIGLRNVIALSTTSELEKTGMNMATLQNRQGEYVAPNVDSMTYALDGAAADQTSGVWKINYDGMDKRGYPGTMISYAAVPTSTLKSAQAKGYADTLRWMSTDAQQYGQDSGQLPDGYLALTDPMRAQAAKVALAVENQTGVPPVPPKDSDPISGPKDPTPDDKPTPTTTTPTSAPTQGATSGPGQNGKTDKPGSNTSTTPAPTPPGSTQPPAKNANTKQVAATTQGESLGWLAWGLPALLAAGLAAGVASPGIRLIAQPGNPVRRGIVAGGNFVASFFRRGRRR